jgi:hypothetical protein
MRSAFVAVPIREKVRRSMTESEAIDLAGRYLASKRIKFLGPGEIQRRPAGKIEVVFIVPEARDPAVAVVDPPDIRVLIDTKTQAAELIYQM